MMVFVTLVLAALRPSWLRSERLTEFLRCAALDRAAMSEDRNVEVERGELAETCFAVLETLVAKRVAEVRHVRARVRGEEQAAARPEQRDLTRTLSGDVNRFESARNRQLSTVVDLLIDRARLDRHWLFRDEHPIHEAAQQPRRRRHRPRRLAFPHHPRLT